MDADVEGEGVLEVSTCLRARPSLRALRSALTDKWAVSIHHHIIVVRNLKSCFFKVNLKSKIAHKRKLSQSKNTFYFFFLTFYFIIHLVKSLLIVSARRNQFWDQSLIYFFPFLLNWQDFNMWNLSDPAAAPGVRYAPFTQISQAVNLSLHSPAFTRRNPVLASGAGMRGHGHYGRAALTSAFSIGGNGTWHSVGSGEVGKEREIVLQSVLPEWDFELKPHKEREKKLSSHTAGIILVFWEGCSSQEFSIIQTKQGDVCYRDVEVSNAIRLLEPTCAAALQWIGTRGDLGRRRGWDGSKIPQSTSLIGLGTLIVHRKRGFCSLLCAAPGFPKAADLRHPPRSRSSRSWTGEPRRVLEEIRTDPVIDGCFQRCLGNSLRWREQASPAGTWGSRSGKCHKRKETSMTKLLCYRNLLKTGCKCMKPTVVWIETILFQCLFFLSSFQFKDKFQFQSTHQFPLYSQNYIF